METCNENGSGSSIDINYAHRLLDISQAYYHRVLLHTWQPLRGMQFPSKNDGTDRKGLFLVQIATGRVNGPFNYKSLQK